MLVVDASSLVPLVAQDDVTRHRILRRITGESLYAPELVYLEVVHVLRRLVLRGALNVPRASTALDDLVALRIHSRPHADLLPRCWELRDNLTVYDAAYVALAEALECSLLTADSRLAAAPGPRCAIEVIPS